MIQELIVVLQFGHTLTVRSYAMILMGLMYLVQM